MVPERWQRLQQVFDACQARPVAQRADHARSACGDDSELLRELLALLRQAERDDMPMREAIGRAALAALQREADAHVGERLGPWRIVAHIADGGMGAVYRAERADGQYQQQVAIKLLGGGRVSAAAKARLQAERQILARLDHPHIARLLDGGASEAGLPYLVMEFVDGEPIDRWCEAQRLDTPARLRLLALVCRAVQYAHASLVVHRDLKPSNILIDGQGRPRLLDFGIAKLIDPAADITRTAERALTPSHASPEQISGGVVTTASDIYALGVLLYELLVGRLPHGDESTPSADLARRIVHTDPPRPSQAAVDGSSGRLARIQRHGERLTPQRLARELSGDLDNIVMMALRKEPERRYPSALALAEDIERHLAHLPVRARPDTFAYRGAKFLRRHPVAVPLTALALLFAVAGAALFTWRLAEQRDHALAAEARARSAADFSASVLRRTGATEDAEREVSIRELLARAADRVSDQLGAQPAVATRMRIALGSALHSWGDYEPARAALQAALAEARQRAGAGGDASAERDIAETLSLLSTVTHDQGQLEVSLDWTRQAEVAWRRVGTPAEQARALGDVAMSLNGLRRREEAEPVFREALAQMRRVHAGDHDDIAWMLNNLAWTLHATGRPREAMPLYEEALAMQRRMGTPPATLAQTLSNFAGVYYDAGDLEAAGRLWSETLTLFEGVFGADGHAAVARTYNLLALVAIDRGQRESALAWSGKALQANLKLLGETHRWTAITLQTRAIALLDAGRTDEAGALLQRALAVSRKVLPAGHASFAGVRLGLGRVALARHQNAVAERELRLALDVIDGLTAPDRVPLGRVSLALGQAVAEQGRRDEGRALVQRAQRWLAQRYPDGHWRRTMVEALAELPPFVTAAAPAARERAEQALQSLRADLGSRAPAVRAIESALAR